MPVHLRIEVKDEIEMMEVEERTGDSDSVDTQNPEDIPQPVVVELVESATLGRGEDDVLGVSAGDRDSDSEFNRQMALLKNVHVDLAKFYAHNRGVSRKHARINLRNVRLTVEDLGSTNGTFINNERLEPNVETPLKEGDELRLGFLTLLVTII